MTISRALAPAALLLLLVGGAVAGATAADATPRVDVGHESWWPELESEPEEHDADAHEADSHDVLEDGAPGHDDHAPAEPVDRPLPLVLGAFGVVNGGVLLTAGVLRHRERAARQARQASRAQRRAVPASGPKAGS